MRHSVIFKREGYYSGMPNMDILPDGRLVAAARVQTWPNHQPVGSWRAFVSEDEGATWSETDDSTIPYNWPGTTPREQLERLEMVQPNGTYICAGAVGHEFWASERRGEAEELGLHIREHPEDDGRISVGGLKLFVQRSEDRGKSWTRREWMVPGMSQVSANRPPTVLEDGTVLYHIYADDLRGDSYNYVWRSTDHGDIWRLHPMGTHHFALQIDETGMVEVAPGRVLAHQRVEVSPQYLIERWSNDGGVTWTDPLRTDIWGFPAHLIKLRDGRILSAYGYRREPGGVRAVLSSDGGVTWNMDKEVVLRDDGGYPSSLKKDMKGTLRPPPGRWQGDVGYPVSVQLPDDSILTAYYITESDGVTHTAVTRWEA